ncbi:hypothetical protein Sjap_008041 [Stephania japonica]|uniref:Uncharacterized protein n=1 Tax=Stephania japonica TaxID=461633 RepID=A0AAP0JR33_9MAGN
MEEEIEAEIIEPFELSFSDLELLSSYSSTVQSSLSGEEIQRLDSISRAVMETLGPSGPGLLLVSPVPKAAADLRRSLLPLARNLALLGDVDRRRVLKEHRLGTDVPLKNPDRRVSSFALQLKYVKDTIALGASNDTAKDTLEAHLGAESLHDPSDDEFNSLEKNLRELGYCMMEVGLLLAQVCDRAIGGQDLEQSILEASAAKGRLIHYHSTLDNFILKEARKAKGSSKRLTNNLSMHLPVQGVSGTSTLNEKAPIKDLNLVTSENKAKSCRTSLSNLWQQWHYDYGIFTVLTAPMFISSIHHPTAEAKEGFCMSFEQECSPPDGHSICKYFTQPEKASVCTMGAEDFVLAIGHCRNILKHGLLPAIVESDRRHVQYISLSLGNFCPFIQRLWNKSRSTKCTPSFTCTQFQNLDRDIYFSVILYPVRLQNDMNLAKESRQTAKKRRDLSGIQMDRADTSKQRE